MKHIPHVLALDWSALIIRLLILFAVLVVIRVVVEDWRERRNGEVRQGSVKDD